MHSKNWLIATIIVLLLSACGGGGGGSNPPAPPVADGGGGDGDTTGDDDGACGVSAQIDFVEGVTESWYLWYDEMASVDKSGFDSAQAYLDARLQPLMDDGRDKGFSYLTTITEDETNISSGAYIGFGWRSDQTGVFIVDVFESGPAFAARRCTPIGRHTDCSTSTDRRHSADRCVCDREISMSPNDLSCSIEIATK